MYVNLHTHTTFSTLDGLDTPLDYMKRAKELGMSHLAITDHGTLAGHREFQRAAKEVGVKPILGLEGYVSETDRFDKRGKVKREDGTSVYNHITMLAKNNQGLKNLNHVSKVAWTEGYYYKPRVDTELLEENSSGLIVLSGCMSGLVAKAIEKGDYEGADNWARRYKEIFGDDYYIEVMSTNEPELNHRLLDIADRFGIKPVMTTDCHYARKEDLWIEEAMLIINAKPKFNKEASLSKAEKMGMIERFNYLYPDRTMSFAQIEVYLRDYQTEVERFAAQGIMRKDIFTNTLEIAEKVSDDYEYRENLDLLPQIDKEHPDRTLESKVMHGLVRLGLAEKPEYVERAMMELNVIKQKEFSVYFLIVADLIDWAEKQGIMVGPGRGSSAGSLVCYALNITKVDPIQYNCLFERFLDLDRMDWPDIDMDFEDKRRNEVKEYAIQKYGNVASIATFNTFGGKSAVKAAAMVLRVSISETNRATKDNDPPDGVDFFEHFAQAKRSKEYARKYPDVIKLAKRLEGKPRSMGMHPAGVVISKVPLEEVASLETAKDPYDSAAPRVPYVAHDMNEVAKIGLIKMDFLGLKALSVIKDTIMLISKRHKKFIDPYKLPLDDPKVYKMLSDGYTRGVFQMEQSAYTKLIINMGGVETFGDLVASNALVRPGAMETIGKQYIARKNGTEPVTYAHPKIRSFTEDTYGLVTLFQEQIMQVVQVLGGLTAGESNQLRRGLGKKDIKYIKPFEEKFKANAVEFVSAKVADQLWSDIEAGAGYSFNIAHSVVYSLLGYITAWLKVNYPLEFISAAISNEKDKDSITDYLLEAKRMGIRVLLPHVNESGVKTEPQNDAIRLGLSNIKYVGEKAAAALIRARPFENYAALQEALEESGNGITSRIVGSMNKVGAAAFEDNPRTGKERENFYEYLQIPAFETKELPPKVIHRMRDIDDYDEVGVFPILGVVRNIKVGDGWARIDVIDETGTCGMFAPPDIQMEKGQMYAILVANNRVARYLTMDELYAGTTTEFSKYLHGEIPELEEGKYRVISFRSRRTKAGKQMADMVVMDHTGVLLPVLVFPDNQRSRSYSRALALCKAGRSLKMDITETQDGSYYLKEI